MDGLLGVGSSLPAWQTRASSVEAAAADMDGTLFAAHMSPNDSDPAEVIGQLHDADPARRQELTLHFMSHVSADCFISLLQAVDPMPDDERRRAEYKRFYRDLHDSLIIPVPPDADAAAR